MHLNSQNVERDLLKHTGLPMNCSVFPYESDDWNTMIYTFDTSTTFFTQYYNVQYFLEQKKKH